MRIMAFIPARGGSKGIPRKNLALLNGKPLIQYAIEAAQRSKYIDDIFLSSDDLEIIRFSESLGLSVPYQRPAKLATDYSPMMDAILHGLNWLKENQCELADSVMLLQPTSPLRNSNDIDKAVELFLEKQTKSLISVHQMIEHPYECVRLENDGWKFLAKSSEKVVRRQDYSEKFCYINGAIYLARTELLIKEKTFIIEGETALYFMSPINGVDVDDIFDLKRAEVYLKYTLKSED